MSSMLEQARSEAYREGFSQGMMVAECDCPPPPQPVNATNWWLFGVMCGSALSWWLA